MADNASLPTFNPMQAALGLSPMIPMPPLSFPFPGQLSAQIAQAAAMAQPTPTFAGGPMLFNGPSGMLMPMQPGGPASPFAGGNAGNPLGGMGPMTPPSFYTGTPPLPPPPAYRGFVNGPGFPLTNPGVPSPYFNTPYAAGLQHDQAFDDRLNQMQMAGYSGGARTVADFGAGMLGARLAGPGHRGFGFVAGFAASEIFGGGAAASNLWSRHVNGPAMNTRAYGAGIEALSQGFMSGGPFGHEGGVGFSRNAATQAARSLQDLATSNEFRAETGGRFNTADVMRIAQGGAQNGLMAGVGSPDQMRDRVRDLAKTVRSFMELANEPDLQEALRTMGNLRYQGLGSAEALQAVSHGRAFARMAGTTFNALAAGAGTTGAQTFGSLGLTQGLGMGTGMMHGGLAGTSQNLGTLSPQMLNMLGGAQGLAGLNSMFSAGLLQSPMLAPAMMTSGGGLNPNAIAALMSGRTDLMGMAGAGANNLGGMTARLGVGGLGMGLAMQPLLQDTIGRMVQSQGPFAQRMMEDRQLMGLAGRMGMSGSQGLVSAGMMTGMTGTQALARAQELADPRFYDRMSEQIDVRRREQASVEARDREERTPSYFRRIGEQSATVMGIDRGLSGLGEGVSDWYHRLAGGGPDRGYGAVSAGEMRRVAGAYGSRLEEFAGRYGRGVGGRQRTSGAGIAADVAEARGMRGWVAGAFGLLNSGEDFSTEVADQQEAGRFFSGVANTTARGRQAAQGRTNALFGNNAAAANDFAQRVAALNRDASQVTGGGFAANAVTALGGAVATGGLGIIGGAVASHFTPGNIAGMRGVSHEQIRDAYVQSMAGSGRSREELEAAFARDGGSAAAGLSARIRSTMTSREIEDMELRASRGNRMSGRDTPNLEEVERRTYSNLLGTEGARDTRARRGLDTLLRTFDVGGGRTEEEQVRNRGFAGAYGLAALQLADPRQNRSNTERRIRELQAEARRRGMTDEQIDEISTRVQGQISRQHLDRDTGTVDLASRTRTTGSAAFEMDRVGRDDRRAELQAMQRAVYGAQALARQHGVVGDLATGVASGGGNAMDFARLRRNVGEIAGDEDRLRELEERAGHGVADAVRRAARGDERAFGEVQGFLGRNGGRGVAAARAYQRQGWASRVGNSRGIGDFFSNLFDAGGEQGYVARQLADGGAAEQDATRQQGEVTTLEGQARGRGMGTAADALLQASEELREATRNLRGAADRGALDDALNP